MDNNWNKWAAISQVISSMAILITLIYLAVETEQNTDAILSTTRQAALEAELSIIDRQVEYPHLRRTMLSGDISGLSEDEIEQVMNHIIGIFRVRENNWMQHESCVMDDETWGVYRNSLVLFIQNTPILPREWEEANQSGFYHPGFLAEMNQALEEAGVLP